MSHPDLNQQELDAANEAAMLHIYQTVADSPEFAATLRDELSLMSQMHFNWLAPLHSAPARLIDQLASQRSSEVPKTIFFSTPSGRELPRSFFDMEAPYDAWILDTLNALASPEEPARVELSIDWRTKYLLGDYKGRCDLH